VRKTPHWPKFGPIAAVPHRFICAAMYGPSRTFWVINLLVTLVVYLVEKSDQPTSNFSCIFS
jgi:hypothetical protein